MVSKQAPGEWELYDDGENLVVETCTQLVPLGAGAAVEKLSWTLDPGLVEAFIAHLERTMPPHLVAENRGFFQELRDAADLVGCTCEDDSPPDPACPIHG